MRTLIALALIVSALIAAPVRAQDVRLRLHHFLPPTAAIHTGFLEPWVQRIQEDSGDRLRVEIVPLMQLGGKPPDLINQLRDGVVDIVATRPGFSPERFPKTEVFELPFVSAAGEPTSKAFWELYETSLADEYRDYKVLATWVDGPTSLHLKGKTVRKIDEVRGLKLSFPNRFTNQFVLRLGAIPVGLPPASVPAALAQGVIDGAILPWNAVLSDGIVDAAGAHTEFSMDRAISTSTFVLAMNKGKYESLPDDLQAVIDKNSGIIISAAAGASVDAGGAQARKAALEKSNEIISLDSAETERWQLVARILEASWIAEMTEKGTDARALVQQARDLVAKHTSR